jgi:peroxiredoxin
MMSFRYFFMGLVVTVAAGLLALPCNAARVSGKVLNVDGAPIEGAQVFINQDRRVRVVAADKEGAYQFNDVIVRVMELVAYHPRFALDGCTTVPIGDMEINLVLTPPATIAIRVINNDFMKIPGARITSMAVNDRFIVSAEDLAEKGFPWLRSNDEGLLDINCIPEGGYIKMTLAHHQYAYSDIAYLPVDSRRRDIILYSGAPLRGRVTADKAPVENARVSLFQVGVGGQHKFAESLTDPEGFYHLRAKEDQYLVAVRHPDYASPPPAPVDLSDPEKTAVADIELLPPYVIRGSILFPDGAPCPGARLLFRIEDTVFEDTFSDMDGAFVLKSGSANGVLRVLPPPGYMTKILADIPVALGEAREAMLQPIKLVQLPVVRGRALFPEGVKPEQVYVCSLDLPVPVHIITDANGAFELRFFYQPEQKQVAFRMEHPFRFLRRDFVINLEAPSEVEMMLEEFEPDLERRPHQPGRNNLDALLGKEAPPIQCTEWFNSQPLKLEDMKGKVVVLTFWGGFDTSHFAMNRLAELKMVYELFKAQDDVVVLGVHDASSESDEIADYLVQYGIPFPIGRDDDPFVSFSKYGVNAIPQTVLIDKGGMLQYAETEGRLMELIKALRRKP